MGRDDAAVYARICAHLDGLALGTVLAGLAPTGVVDALLRQSGPAAIVDLAASSGVPDGYLALALQQLALQGLATRSPDGDGTPGSVLLTPDGRDRLADARAYDALPARIDAAIAWLRSGEGDPVPADDDRPEPVGTAFRAPAVAAALVAMTRDGSEGVSDWAGPALRAEGWARWESTGWRLTDPGRLAHAMAAQYAYAVGYLPLLAQIPARLSGSAPAIERTRAHDDTFVDRAIDVRFSGQVYRRMARTPFLATALPLVQGSTGDGISAIVDCGCGDGSMLADLGMKLRRSGSHVPRLVAVDASPVALSLAGARLAETGMPYLTLRGDIADPESLMLHLTLAGVDTTRTLHVSKSVLHDRAIAPEGARETSPRAHGAYACPGGRYLPPSRVEADLASLLDRWRRCLCPAGMIAVEAHAVPDPLIAERRGRTPYPITALTHGFSHQYLIEWQAYAAAIGRSGLRCRSQTLLGEPIFGAPSLSVCHLTR